MMLDIYEEIVDALNNGDLNFNRSDIEIANKCYELFGIPADKVLESFNNDPDCMCTTIELIVLAYDPNYFG